MISRLEDIFPGLQGSDYRITSPPERRYNCIVCDDAEHEPGFEKIAVYASPDGTPTHAARQLPSGRWTSKLGRMEDIEHALRDLEGTEHGGVLLVMKRPSASA